MNAARLGGIVPHRWVECGYHGRLPYRDVCFVTAVIADGDFRGWMWAYAIKLNPGNQSILADQAKALGKEYLPEMDETNLFIHMGMHIAIHEQLKSNGPAGIREICQKLNKQTGDTREAEHQMMECLSEMMWQAQRQSTAPDESLYLTCLRQLIRK